MFAVDLLSQGYFVYVVFLNRWLIHQFGGIHWDKLVYFWWLALKELQTCGDSNPPKRENNKI